MPDATHAYIALAPCGHVYAVTVDTPSMTASNATAVARWIREGATIERVPLEDARRRFTVCLCGRARTARRVTQLTLDGCKP